MSEFVQVMRQPIIDSAHAVYGFELLHRDIEGKAVDHTLTDRTKSAQVILSVFNLIGRERAVGDALAFFNIAPEFLSAGIIEALPTGHCVFEIKATSPLEKEEAAKLIALYDAGYRFALDNFAVSAESLEEFRSVLPYITYLKIDVLASDIGKIAEFAPILRAQHTLIAQKIEDIDTFSAYRDFGFDYFQGYYIQHPAPVKHYRLEPNHIGLLRLYAMLEKMPFSEFAAAFERHNELTIQFFQYLLSMDIKRYDATQSVRDLVQDVGKEVLRRWFALVIYASGRRKGRIRKGEFSHFFDKRVELMRAIVSNVHTPDVQRRDDELKLLAIFSTLVDIYQIPFDTLEGAFKLDGNLEKWIVDHKGRFSLIYKAVNLLQHTPLDVDKVNRVLKSFKTDYHELNAKLKRVS